MSCSKFSPTLSPHLTLPQLSTRNYFPPLVHVHHHFPGLGKTVKPVHGAGIVWSQQPLPYTTHLQPSHLLQSTFTFQFLRQFLIFPTWRTVSGVTANHIVIAVFWARLPGRRHDRLFVFAFSCFEQTVMPSGCCWDYSASPVRYTTFPV